MNRTALVITILLTGLFHSSGQKFGIEVSGGFSLSTSPELITSGISTGDGHTFSGTNSIEKIPFGMGSVGKIYFTYNLPKNLFIKAGLRMFTGSSDHLVYSDYQSVPGQSAFRKKETSFKYSFVDADLILGLNYTLSDRTSLQIGAGPLLQTNGKILEETHEYMALHSDGTSEIEDRFTELLTKTRFNTGVVGYLGLSYALNPKWDIVFNSTMRMGSWIPARSEITRLEVNGQDQLRDISESQRQWTYANEVNVETANSQTTLNGERIRFYIPNNQIDFTVGLKYNFGSLVPEPKNAPEQHSKKMFIDYALGFGIGLSRTSFYEKDFYTRIITSENSVYTSEKTNVVPFSYGSGINGRIAAGIYLNQHLALELSELYNFSYFTLKNNELTENEMMKEQLEEEIVYSGQLFRTLLGIRIEYPFGRLSPYVKTGISIAYGGFTKWSYTSDFTHHSESEGIVRDHSEVILKNYGGASLGAYTGIGTSLKMNENTHLFLEGLALAQNYSPTKGSVIKAEHNGVNLLNTLSKAEREIEYVDQIEYSGGGQNPNMPTKQLRFSEPFSSVMIQMGVRYSFPLVKMGK